MKSILQIVLVILLWINGVGAIISGSKMLYCLHFVSWINILLLPGILFFILSGILSIVMSFFVKHYPKWVIASALVQGVCLLATLTDPIGKYYGQRSLMTLLGLEGVVLIVAAILLLAMEFMPLQTDSHYKST